ncbi:hypothetical protein BDP55DRAFT_685465 [Colletotrichum godetiae]|uniref:Zn(2)-C6 fungal-type domain-containing protein n=1 Tax=Colletotrichum godetiae TaxID=1209918 RepID=A0AAJ0EQD7_9PEZI|nr:uncharacterized protein BDP55DRAFT_685465 [Colletotrichum godetiae]KAK1657484.1 hypothetical protein BDP55DRAFT_685465 [Colletotrichum godetiae]
MSGRRYSERRRPGERDLSGGQSAITKKTYRPKACAECRRLKTKCCKVGPCKTCQRRKVDCSLLGERKVDSFPISNQSPTSCVKMEYFENASNPNFSGHLRRVSAMPNDYIAPVTAPGKNDVLQPGFKSEPQMTHWVVYERFDSGKLVYSGLGESCCVPLNCVRGFDKLILQAMEQHQCLLSESGYHEGYLNALTMLSRDIVM